jgi:hypothetical protein
MIPAKRYNRYIIEIINQFKGLIVLGVDFIKNTATIARLWPSDEYFPGSGRC